MSLKFTIHGTPVPQGRPRFTRVGKGVRTYDPAKSKAWKELIKWQAIENRVEPMEGPLLMRLKFILRKPKYLPRRVIHHIKKPDLDNLIKGVKDGLEGVAFHNDSQIVALNASKEYGEEPRVEVIIEEV